MAFVSLISGIFWPELKQEINSKRYLYLNMPIRDTAHVSLRLDPWCEAPCILEKAPNYKHTFKE